MKIWQKVSLTISLPPINSGQDRLPSMTFIQNRIMHGTRYISTIREDLTFVVYNLYPDYVYPGEVIRVDVTVEGTPEGSKRVEIEIETHTENELDYSTGGVVVFQISK